MCRNRITILLFLSIAVLLPIAERLDGEVGLCGLCHLEFGKERWIRTVALPLVCDRESADRYFIQKKGIRLYVSVGQKGVSQKELHNLLSDDHPPDWKRVFHIGSVNGVTLPLVIYLACVSLVGLLGFLRLLHRRVSRQGVSEGESGPVSS